MTWKPLVKTELDLKGQSKSEIIERNLETIKRLNKENNGGLTGKQIRKAANKSYKDMMREKIYANDLYQVNLDDFTYEGWIHLSIKNKDKSQISKSKWQHFQWIKNQLCGEESEALELYPAESRLVNTANQYHLWVTRGKSLPVGWKGGRVTSDKSQDGVIQTLETK